MAQEQESSDPIDVAQLAQRILDDRVEDTEKPDLDAISARYRDTLARLTPDQQCELLLALLDEIAIRTASRKTEWQRVDTEWMREALGEYVEVLVRINTTAPRKVCVDLLELDPPLTHDQIYSIFQIAMRPRAHLIMCRIGTYSAFIRFIERRADELFENTTACKSLRSSLREFSRRNYYGPARMICSVRDHFLPPHALPIDPGEAWSDAAIEDIGSLPLDDRAYWRDLFLHCSNTKPSKPSARWLRKAQQLIEGIPDAQLERRLLAWFPLYDKPRTGPHPTASEEYEADHNKYDVIPHHEYIMKGLCWITPLLATPALPRALADLAISAYRKPKYSGPRAMKLGNAAIYALGEYPRESALAELSRLQQRIKVVPAQRAIQKAMLRVAERSGIAPEDIDELAVPTYGFASVGEHTIPLGDATARLRLSDGAGRAGATMFWTNAKGRMLKNPPADVRRDYPEDVKVLKGMLKDIARILPAQKDRIDSLMLKRKTWSYPAWRDRYLDHPIIGTITRRLVWIFDDGQSRTPAAWHAFAPDGPAYADGQLVRVDGSPFVPPDESTVSLWHPIHQDADRGTTPIRSDTDAWREFFEQRHIRQPFRQAHREIYLPTESERSRPTHIDRFAGHNIRQNQFKSLCMSRGWHHKMILACEPEYGMPHRMLGEWNLKAILTIEPASDGDPVYSLVRTHALQFFDSAETVPAIYAATTQHDTDATPAQPIPITEIPPLVLSEVLRDVDFFVSVAGVGTDIDSLIDESKRTDYTSDGDMTRAQLSGLIESRRELIARLLPQLAIQDACTLTARHLIVLGRKRTYRIHLASANVFIAQESRSIAVEGVPRDLWLPRNQRIFTPFEGDATLESILAKALLLAHDDTITNPTILRQLERATTRSS